MPFMKLLLFITMLFYSVLGVTQAKQIGLVMVSKGTSEIIRHNETSTAKIGQKIFEGDQIQTKDDGFLKIVMTDRNILVVTASTQMTIEKYELKKTSIIQLNQGSLRHRVQKNYDGLTKKYEVKTPAAVMGVRGTDFISEYDLAKQETVLCTLEGKSSFKSNSFPEEVFTEKDQFIRYKKDSGKPQVITVKQEWLKKALEKHIIE